MRDVAPAFHPPMTLCSKARQFGCLVWCMYYYTLDNGVIVRNLYLDWVVSPLLLIGDPVPLPLAVAM